LGTLGGVHSSASAINAVGAVVGFADTSDSNPHAFLYQDGVMRDLGTLGGIRSYATAINRHGDVVGGAGPTDGNSLPQWFLYQNGTMTELDAGFGPISPPPGIITDEGVIVGRYAVAPNALRGYEIRNGVRRDMGVEMGPVAANANGLIVGESRSAAGLSRAMLLDGRGVLTDLGSLDGTWAQAKSINVYGQVVGDSGFGGTGQLRHAFLWTKGAMSDLGTLNSGAAWGGSYSVATGINAAGQVVGESVSPSGYVHGFVYQNGALADLNDLTDVRSGWMITGTFGINDVGQIAANGVSSGNFAIQHALLLTPADVQLPGPLTAAVSPTALNGALTPAGSHATVRVTGTASISGGRPPYRFAWRLAGGQSGITIQSPDQAATVFSATLPMCDLTRDTAILTVTDSAGRVAEATATVSLRVLRRPRSACP
jgi:probable HAF family extracellular repeat protein